MDTDKLKLYEFILDHYSQGELKDLCFYLNVVYDDLDGGARRDKARELVEYVARRRRLDDLRAVLGQQRPEQYGKAFLVQSGAVGTSRQTVPTMSDRRIHEKTGITLIRIPAGPFLYGSSADDPLARANEKPQRIVDLPEYWIARTPVTNAQYKRFIDANPNYRVPFSESERDRPFCWDRLRRTYPVKKADHPVVLVSCNDAMAYCEWAGLVLPTEEQWEKAARGIDGRIWPWGNEPPTAEHCNFNRNIGSTSPIDQYSPKGDSDYACNDMAGNVWEWTASWYLADKAPAVRGGSWSADVFVSRIAFRGYNDPSTRVNDGGFRVVELLSDPGS